MNKYIASENLAMFLIQQTGSVLSTWKGKMTATQQKHCLENSLVKVLLLLMVQKK